MHIGNFKKLRFSNSNHFIPINLSTMGTLPRYVLLGRFFLLFLKEEKKKICIGREISLNFVELMLKLFDREIIFIAQVKIFAERGTKIFSMPQQN